MSAVLPDGTVSVTDLRDPIRSVRCFATTDAQPIVHVRAGCARPDDPSAQVVHDAVILPRVWDFYRREERLRPLTDHGHVVGVDVSMTSVEPQLLWETAAALHVALSQAVDALSLEDGVSRTVGRVAAARTENSHDLATSVTSMLRTEAPGAGTAWTSDQVIAHVRDNARDLIGDSTAHEARLAPTVFVTAALEQRPPATTVPDAVLEIELPAARPAPPWIEVTSPRADLAYLQIRRAIPPVRTVRELAATYIANQALTGPYHSVVDDTIRFQEATSYLWDCVADLENGEFLMLAAPDPDAVDRVVATVHSAHTDAGPLSGEAVDAARRLVRTGLLRRLGSTQTALATQSEAQRRDLPPGFLASLLVALRETADSEVRDALQQIVVTPLHTTVVLPSRGI